MEKTRVILCQNCGELAAFCEVKTLLGRYMLVCSGCLKGMFHQLGEIEPHN